MGMSSDLDISPFTESVPCGSSITIHQIGWNYEYLIEYTGSGCMMICGYSGVTAFYVVASDSSSATYHYKRTLNPNGDNPRVEDEYNRSLGKSMTHNGKTVYYTNFGTRGLDSMTYEGAAVEITPYSGPSSEGNGNIAWTMIYGTEPFHTTQHIPVVWNSGYRSEPYQTSFSITVNYNE